ncbi:MAG: hypothetical protein IT305_29535 [Chloroflexi bacterium]|nr:hypothetical protein [Chloroflexota bacterium]
MTTRLELRARIRSELNDSGAAVLWSDSLLDRWIVEGVRALGRAAGVERTASLTSVAGQAGYALPADALEVVRVEYPSGQVRTPLRLAGGEMTPDGSTVESAFTAACTAGIGSTYDVWAGQLVLAPTPAISGEAIVVRYRGALAEPSSDGSVLEVSSGDEDLLTAYACVRALRWIGMDEAKRQRFERQRGADPATSRHEYERSFDRMLAERRSWPRARRLVVR